MVPVAAAAWGAGLVGVLAPDLAGWLAVAGGLVCAASAIRMAVRGPTVALSIVGVGAAFAAAVAAQVWLAEPSRSEARAWTSDGDAFVTATIDVETKVRRVGENLWFDGDATTLRVGHATADVALPVTVAVPVDALAERAALDLGAVVEIRGSARAADAGDRAVLVVFADAVRAVAEPHGVLAVAAALRDGFAGDVVAGLPEPGAGLLPGLAVGDTRAIPPELDADMKASSLTHLTAVSGANCAIVVGLAFGLAALLRLPRPLRFVLAGAVLAGFVVLVTPEPSVVRAASMAGIAMLSLLAGRAGAGVPALAAAVVILLLVDPWLATSYGFALSAAATAALLLLAGPLARGLERVMPRLLALAIAVPLSAQLACGPIILLLAPAVPLYGVVANLVAAPAAPAATVVGLLACVLQGLPVVAQGLAAVAWAPAAWIAQTAHVFAALPGAAVPWWGGLGGFVALAIVDAATVVVILRPAHVRTAVRRAAAAVLAIAVGAGAGAGALGGVAGPLTTPAGWSIALCDVEQGDAIVLRSSDAVALVDTGPEPEALRACLARLGVDRIEMLVLTHFDLDHVGGVEAVAGRTGTLLHGPVGDDGSEWIAQARAQDVVEASAGMTGRLAEAEWRVLWPRPASRAFPEGNDASVVIEFAGAGVPRTLLLGDLGASAQSVLLATGAVSADYDVVKVAHHGSADQDGELYRLAAPDLALVGVGADNDYGHPTDVVLAELAAIGAAVARTDLDGLVLAGQDARGLWVWREKGG
ncbi:ComEC/Rec2 family competence protein [Microbacterium gilvum]|uniref:ComEC/Rec2 family competence protein n=2 Tax=Microbacterium gilvum TaxID=1336204 RepID=A0ABP8ZTD6_9MICO